MYGLSRCIRGAAAKSKLFKAETIRRNWQLIPLAVLHACMMIAIPFIACHRLFVTTIDVQLTDYQRFEIPSVPRFFDLRKPRSLKPIGG
ncbi:uncharacterized protein LOC116846028 isoform X2 [Odontomachus brunneus]|uniref:uncharacterized protein LOC116846028 isoform X2 n=1 Tax=Odontomachus brunneus TaxID=486640 RepID=UPI0013F1FC0A|nr:uncharacterized protein LOC116846028 isoform X2 [Odontomachus brunneus]